MQVKHQRKEPVLSCFCPIIGGRPSLPPVRLRWIRSTLGGVRDIKERRHTPLFELPRGGTACRS